MMSVIEDSNRIKAFRRELITEIPRFPNNKTSLQALEAKDLTDLLITYIGWRLRYVAVRPRKITGISTLDGDPRAATLKANIGTFLQAVEDGHDLTPYLSLDPHTRGYTPTVDSRSPGANTWEDKDFVLNVMGLHHFHLGLIKETPGHMQRTNEVVFASVTRDTFEILGLFTHAAFNYEDDDTMTPERVKLWSIYETRQAAGALPGQLMTGGYGGRGITLSSQPVAVTLTAQWHVRTLREIEPKLDDPAYVRALYAESGVPRKPKLKWHYRQLDLGLLDKDAGFFGILVKGPN